MANYFRLGDPMDTNFTNSIYSVDLTAMAKKDEPTQIKSGDGSVPLSALMDENSIKVDSEDTANTPKAKVIMDQNSMKNVREFDPTVLIPKKEKTDPGADEVFSALDQAVERTKKEITEFHNDLEAEMYEQFLDKQDDVANGPTVTNSYSEEPVDEDNDLLEDTEVEEETPATEPEKVINVPKKEEVKEEPKVEIKEVAKPSKLSISRTVDSQLEYEDSELDQDLKDMEEDVHTPEPDDEEADAEERLKRISEAARGAIKPKNTIDLSKFSIGKKPIKASTLIVNTVNDNTDIADWVMYDADRAIAVRGLTGSELIKIGNNNDSNKSLRSRMNALKDTFKIIYDHIVDENKPDYYTWMKQTKFSDVDHIYFALYMATFHGSNFISYQCPDCGKVFIKDIPFSDCIKYSSDKVKEKVKEMQNKTTDNGIIPYNVDLIQVSDKFVFGMKVPSIYTIAIESASLPDNILNKYGDLIDTINYIDAVYTIDYTNMELIPVTIPVVKDDVVKSAAKKIKTLYDIIKNLTSDEFFAIRGYITNIENPDEKINYIMPSTKCPECDAEVPGIDANAEALLFTRHQLGAFANM